MTTTAAGAAGRDTPLGLMVTGDVGRGADLGAPEEMDPAVADLRRTAEQLQRANDEAASRTYEVSSPDGSVRAVANGQRRLVALELDPVLLRRDAETMGRILTMALNEVLRQAQLGSQEVLLAELPPNLRGEFAAALESSQREVR